MTPSTGTASRTEHAAHKTGTLSPQERSILWDMEEHFWTSDADDARATTATNAVMNAFPKLQVKKKRKSEEKEISSKPQVCIMNPSDHSKEKRLP